MTRKAVEAHVRSILAKLDLPEDLSENRRVHAVLVFPQAGADSKSVVPTFDGPV